MLIVELKNAPKILLGGLKNMTQDRISEYLRIVQKNLLNLNRERMQTKK